MPNTETPAPCPFCGSAPRLERFTYEYAYGCTSDACKVRPSTKEDCRTPEEALAAWNTRAHGWTPVTEKLPPDFDPHTDDMPDRLLVCCGIHSWMEFAVYVSGAFVEAFTEREIREVTHWMFASELPAPYTPTPENKER